MHRLTWIVIGLLILVCAACGQETPQVLPTLEPSPTPLGTPTLAVTAISALPPEAPITLADIAKPGMVRIVQTGDLIPLNIYADGEAIATNLNFGQFTDLTPMEAGDYTIRVTASGAAQDESPLTEAPFTIQSDETQLLVVAKQGGTFQLLTFPETETPVNAGESIITVINTIPDTANVQVKRDNADLTRALAFGETETTGALPSGQTPLTLQTASTATPYAIQLEAGQHYTLILGGTAGEIQVASTARHAPGRATVRAIHASQQLNNLDIYLDDELLVGNAAFGRPTEWRDVIAGDYTVEVFEAGADQTTSEPLFSQTLTIPNGDHTGLLVLGDESSIRVATYTEDLSPTPAGQARIAFVNTLPDVPTVRVETSGGQIPGVPDLGFGSSPIPVYLSASTHNFYMSRTSSSDDNLTVETVLDVQLEQGRSYLYLITGRSDEQPVVLSENVGIDENLSVDAENDPTFGGDIQVRLINAIIDQTPVDLQIGAETVISNLGYGQGSDLVSPQGQDLTLNILAAGSSDVLQTVSDTLEGGGQYTLVVSGENRDNVRVMVVPESDLSFGGASPHLRLINVSANNDSLIGIGFSPQDPTQQASNSAAPSDDLRRSIPGGMQQLIDSVPGGSVSTAALLPSGIFSLEILDAVTAQWGATIPNVALDPGAHYDVIAYEEQDTTRIQAFVVAYPARLD